MHGDQALALGVTDLESGVGHAERGEQVIAQVGVEPLAADGLDRLADVIDVDAVFPARAGIGHQRQFQRVVLAGGDGGQAGFFQILHHVAVPHIVAEAGGVGHEMAQRDRVLRRPQFWRAIGVETFEHLRGGEIGQHLADRGLERELALLDELHGGRRRDRLGHRGDPEHAVGRHGVVLGQVALAERALVDHLFAVRGDRDHAGNFLGLALLPQDLIDLGFALHGCPPVIFEAPDFPPGRDWPQAWCGSRAQRSRSRDRGGVDRGCFSVDWPASSGDRPAWRRYLSASEPGTNFGVRRSDRSTNRAFD